MIEEKMYGLVGEPYNDLRKVFATFSDFNENVKYTTDVLIDIESEIKNI